MAAPRKLCDPPPRNRRCYVNVTLNTAQPSSAKQVVLIDVSLFICLLVKETILKMVSSLLFQRRIIRFQ